MVNDKPLVVAALICERILNEGGIFSAIRIVDTYVRQSVAPTQERDLAGTQIVSVHQPFDMSVLVILKAGTVVGKHAINLGVRHPNGKQITFPQTFNVEFAKGDPADGAAMNVKFSMPPETAEGLYWIDVLWDGEKLTSTPLKIVQRVAEQSASDGAVQ